MKHAKQYVDCGRFTELRPILKKWCSLNRLYMNNAEGDCPWWYNERTSIGVLAAAAWKSGHLALEEFSTLKGRKKDATHGPGRCDLKIRVGSEDFLFEAKQSWPRLSKKPGEADIKESRRKILNSLQRACLAAGRLKSREGRRFGVCFLAPRISEVEIDNLDKRVDSLIDLLMEKRRMYHSISWFFANRGNRPNDKHRIYPGVLLLIKEVHKYQPRKKRSSRKGSLRDA